MTEQIDQPGSIDTKSTENGDAAPARDATPAQMPPPAPKAARKKKLAAGALGVVVLAGVVVFGIPWIKAMLNTVSTDDAFVNGHVTFVAPRVAGQVSRVLVDDNYRVKKGALLVQLDKEPFEDQVALKKAAVAAAEADLVAAEAQTRGLVAQIRSDRSQLQRAIEDVHTQ